jgi:hypothetical protein
MNFDSHTTKHDRVVYLRHVILTLCAREYIKYSDGSQEQNITNGIHRTRPSQVTLRAGELRKV